MNVVSLCDGISCGRLALEKAGIKVDNYYSSEIDEKAIEISKKNWPDIIRLGDVTKITNEMLDSLPKIDLVFYGSPCQSLSFLGTMKGFEGTSGLFHDCTKILNYLKIKNPDLKFLVENVVMKKECQDVFDLELGVKARKIDSRLLSAAKRRRLYWTNISFGDPEDKNITFDDINQNSQDWLPKATIDKIQAWKAQQKPLKNATLIGSQAKLPCLTARGYNQYHSGMILISDGLNYRYLSDTEAELAMNLPIGYTDGVASKYRSHAIGNGWTVDIISHIFKGIK